MKCSNCNKEINETDKFCGFCGYKFNNQTLDKSRIESYSDERPVEIYRAIILIYATVAIGVISLFSNGRFSFGNFLVYLIVFGLYVFLSLMLKQRKNWARIVLTVLFGLGCLLSISALQYIKWMPFVGIISILQIAINIYIIYLMYSKSSNQWFK